MSLFTLIFFLALENETALPPLGAYEKSKKELQYPAACGGVVYRIFKTWTQTDFWIYTKLTFIA